MAPGKVTVRKILKAKAEGRRLVMVTAYDYPTARIADEAGVDMLLVGDSAAMVVHGLPSTLQATLDMMVLHTAAVARARPRALVVADMPFGSYEPSTARAVESAVKLARAGAEAVKLEGGSEYADRVRAILEDAMALVEAGVFAIVIEYTRPEVAEEVTRRVPVPTICIGSGAGCDGQVLVFHDLVGLTREPPPFAKPRANAWEVMRRAIEEWAREVRGS